MLADFQEGRKGHFWEDFMVVIAIIILVVEGQADLFREFYHLLEPFRDLHLNFPQFSLPLLPIFIS